jgi:hypothetical protein
MPPQGVFSMQPRANALMPYVAARILGMLRLRAIDRGVRDIPHALRSA